MTLPSLHTRGSALDIPARYRDPWEQLFIRHALALKDAIVFPTHNPHTSAPEFDPRVVYGTRVKLTRKGHPDEVHEFTVRALWHNGPRLIAVRPANVDHRYNAADYDLAIVTPALPTEPGLYVANGSDATVVYRLDPLGHWTRWDTSRTNLESTTAYSVSTEAGAYGLVELVAASS